ncbi:MAG: argininosuccinate lyase, partial [Eggerthellaceae bacterium]|nr:argininosuccinate lyase [Eggerthellaceae bacterium]
ARLMAANLALRDAIYEKAKDNFGVIMPGYTHLQHAQPVLLSHHLLAYTWMLARDFRRMLEAWEAADISPLGAAALAGTTYPLDRTRT